MVEDMACTCKQYLFASRRNKLRENQAKNLHRLLLRGKLQTVVQWITERNKGGVLKPRDACTNKGEVFLDVLQDKHPDSCTPSARSLDSYPVRPPELVSVNPKEDTVIEVARHLSGGARTGDTDLVGLQHWLLRFGEAIGKLRHIIAVFPSVWRTSSLDGHPIAHSCQDNWLSLTIIL